MFPKARTTAENIVKRHLRYEPETADWVFTHDVRTYGQKQRVHLTKEQSDSFARSLKLPLLMITAQKGSFSWQKSKVGKVIMSGVEGRKRLIADFTEIVSTDHFHHMHSDDAPYTASLVMPWLLEKHRPASKL
ncbi:hypothetical protein DIPPA_08869 [Diplonema papillatum]|nr:hypothetical protein DIPPA_08869 [Diplonema papillatum]